MERKINAVLLLHKCDIPYVALSSPKSRAYFWHCLNFSTFLWENNMTFCFMQNYTDISHKPRQRNRPFDSCYSYENTFFKVLDKFSFFIYSTQTNELPNLQNKMFKYCTISKHKDSVAFFGPVISKNTNFLFETHSWLNRKPGKPTPQRPTYSFTTRS